MHLRRVRSFVLLCMALCAMLSAQSDSGSIVGFVKDPSGGVVPKAKISVKNESTGIVRRVETNEENPMIRAILLACAGCAGSAGAQGTNGETPQWEVGVLGGFAWTNDLSLKSPIEY